MRFLFSALIVLLATGAQADTFVAPHTVAVAAGKFVYGSDKAEREYGYQLDEKAYGHSVTRKQGWYDDEARRRTITLPKFFIMKTPVTNAQYAAFLAETNHRRPYVGRATWASYRLVHPYSRAQKYNWASRTGPSTRRDHPVVLVSYGDAQSYADWLSRKTGQRWRLPTSQEWEKAARGTDGRYFAWGNTFDPSRLNSHDKGPFSTTRVGKYALGASPYGVLDTAGQVFEWTAMATRKGRHLVKGGSWDDKGCGVCRAAAGHSRPDAIKHILIGFRLVREAG